MKNEPEALFDRFRSEGDLTALAEIFDHIAPDLLAVARHLARNEGEAEDFVQATFLVVIERAHAFDATRRLLPWLLGVLVRHAKKVRRSEGRTIDPESVHVPMTCDPVQEAEDLELREAVGNAVAGLPAKYRRLLELHLTEGLASIQLAQRLGIAPGTVRVQMHRGMRLLRRALPAGFAGGAAIVGTARRGLASVRADVLGAAGADRVIAVGGASGVLVAKVLVAVGLGAGALALGRSTWAVEELDASENAALLAAAQQETERRGEEAEPMAAESEAFAPPELAAPTSRTPGSAAATRDEGEATVRGRFVLEDGGPAAGVRARLHGWQANTARVREHGVPDDWHDPDTVETDADGRFVLTLVPPRAFQFTFDAVLEGYATCSWRWSEIERDKVLDLGETVMPRAGTLVVRLVDSSGEPLHQGWRVSADAAGRPTFNGREIWSGRGELDTAAAEFWIRDAPPGRVQVEARGPTNVGATSVVEIIAGEQLRTELRYEGQPTSGRILLRVNARPYPTALWPGPEHVFLRTAQGETRSPEPSSRRSSFIFEDVGPGPHTMEIVDARFESWSQSEVWPGVELRARLRGSATVVVRAEDAETGGELALEAVTLSYPESGRNHVELLRSGSTPPAEGRFEGVVPGECALTVSVSGFPPVNVAVPGLSPGEVRTVVASIISGTALSGRVVDEAGAPTEDVWIQLTRGPRAGHTFGSGTSIGTRDGVLPEIDLEVRSNGDGRFTLPDLAAGEWTIRAQWSSWLVVDRTVVVGEETGELVFARPPSAFLTGRVLVPENVDPSTVTIRVRLTGPIPPPASLGPPWHGLIGDLGQNDGAVDIHGSFKLGALPLGEITLDCVASDGSWGRGGIHDTTVTLDGEPLELDLRTVIPGRVDVIIRIDGQLATGGIAEIRPSQGELWMHGRGVEVDGTCGFIGITPGLCRLAYRAIDAGWLWTYPELTTLVSAGTAVVALELTTAVGTVQFLDAASGEPIASRRVQWRVEEQPRSSRSSPAAEATTDAEGRLQLEWPLGAEAWFATSADAPAVQLAWDGTDTMIVRLSPD